MLQDYTDFLAPDRSILYGSLAFWVIVSVVLLGVAWAAWRWA